MERPYNTRQKKTLRFIGQGKKVKADLLKKVKERIGSSEATLKRDLKLFIDEGDVEYRKPYRYPITTQGEEYLKSIEPTLQVRFKDADLDRLVNKLPTEAHRSLFWCYLSSIVSKKYLLKEERFRSYNANYIVIGLTGDIKSLVAETMCQVLSFLPVEKYVRDVSTCTAKELLGRRYDIGKYEYRLKLSPYWDLPMVCLDEIDKAEGAEVWRAILYMLNGKRDFEIEKTPIKHEATVLAIMNPSEKWTLPPNVLRRSFVVDFTGMNLDPRKMVDIGEEIAHGKIPHLNIDNLRVNFNKLDKQDLKLLKDLLYGGLKGIDEYRLVNPPTLEKVVLGWLLLSQGGDKTEAIYWGVMQALTFLQTTKATKEGWREELGQKWGDYKAGRDPNFEKEWEAYLAKLKQEEDDIKIPTEPPTKEPSTDKTLLIKYSPKLDRLKQIKTSFEEMDGNEQSVTIWCLNIELKRFTSKLPTEKRDNKVTEDVLRDLEAVLTDWEEQHKPIREAWEEEQKNLKEAKDRIDQYFRYLKKLKGVLISYFGRGKKDKNGTLWSYRTEEVREDIGKILNLETRKKFFNKPFLDSIEERARVLLTERKQQGEEAKTKKAGLVEMPQVLSGIFEGLTQEESTEVIEEAVESVGVGQPIKTTRTVPYWKYLLIMLDRKLKSKGKNKPKEPRSTGYMGRSIDDI